MKWTWALPAITALCFASGGFAQDRQTKNPREGDPQAIRNGTALYRIRCSGCHGMDATGLRGPDLSRIGSSRSRAALTKEIRTASASVQPGYDAVTLVTRDGRRIRGIRKNEDAFSIQIMDVNERLQGHMKSELREIIEEKGSLMPDYGVDKLPAGDFTDLLAYLSRQRAT